MQLQNVILLTDYGFVLCLNFFWYVRNELANWKFIYKHKEKLSHFIIKFIFILQILKSNSSSNLVSTI